MWRRRRNGMAAEPLSPSAVWPSIYSICEKHRDETLAAALKCRQPGQAVKQSYEESMKAKVKKMNEINLK